MTVRELGADEWREARDLRLRALADTPAAFLRSLAEEQAFGDDVWRDRAAARDDRRVFVCHEGGDLVGTVVGLREGADVYLAAMWVAPSHRRRGLGRELVERVVEWARALGTAAVVLEVNEALEPAVALYERAGFRPTGARRPLPTDPGHDAVELRLELD